MLRSSLFSPTNGFMGGGSSGEKSDPALFYTLKPRVHPEPFRRLLFEKVVTVGVLFFDPQHIMFLINSIELLVGFYI